MHLALERNHLLKALGHVQRVVETRNTYPILANVLLWADGSTLGLRATDLDIEVTDGIPANVIRAGRTTVSAKKLYEVIRKLDGAEVKLDADGSGNMLVVSGRSRFNLPCIGPESYPDLKSGAFSSEFDIPIADLRELLDRTAFAASTEETRYYLNGIHLHPLEGAEGTMIRAVATDGHRLARTEVKAPAGAASLPSIIVPRKTVTELQKLLDAADGETVHVEVSDSKIRVRSGEVILVSKLIEGTFPDYERVTPKNNDKRLSVDRKELETAVDRVSTIASDKGGKAVKMSARDGALVVSVTNPDHGEARDEMRAEFDVDGFEIGFNARYLQDILGQLRTESMEFLFSEPGSPTLLKETGDGKALYVLMPMRI